MTAARFCRSGSRKVGTPQGRVLVRARSERSDGTGQQRADRRWPDLLGGAAQARVKRCGKSAPASGAIPAARQPPPGARPSSGTGGSSAASLSGAVRHPRVGRTDGWSPNGTPARDPGTESRLQIDSPTLTRSQERARLRLGFGSITPNRTWISRAAWPLPGRVSAPAREGNRGRDHWGCALSAECRRVLASSGSPQRAVSLPPPEEWPNPRITEFPKFFGTAPIDRRSAIPSPSMGLRQGRWGRAALPPLSLSGRRPRISTSRTVPPISANLPIDSREPVAGGAGDGGVT